jgi:hypothetical protein
LEPRRVPWLRLLAEGGVIIASVLLALAADAWWDGRQERVEEAQTLAGLRNELRANRETVAQGIDIISEARDQLRALASPTTSLAGAAPKVSMRVVLSPIHRNFPLQLADGFRSSTVSAGKLALIRDPVIRATLVDTGAFEETLTTLDDRLGNLSEDGAVALARYPEALDAYRSDQPVDERMVPLAFVETIRQDREVMAIVGAKINYWNGYIGELGRLDAHLQRLIGLIDATVPD